MIKVLDKDNIPSRYTGIFQPSTRHILNPFIKDGRIKHTHISTKFRKFVTAI
ncbi:MAG: hypothetical protein FWE03_03850 [Firmicutes bacterium]|nr:hypothetical protein [Bacillota bacterium]